MRLYEVTYWARRRVQDATQIVEASSSREALALSGISEDLVRYVRPVTHDPSCDMDEACDCLNISRDESAKLSREPRGTMPV